MATAAPTSRPLRALLLPLALVASLSAMAGFGSACRNRAQTASENLRDAVVGYNDALRFGRTDLALERVAPTLRTQFVGSHYRWGRALEITDYEVVNVEAAGAELEHAASYVTYGWVERGSVYVRETLVRQEWRKEGSQYVLIDERVVDGDAALLAIPEGFRVEDSAFAGADAVADAGVP